MKMFIAKTMTGAPLALALLFLHGCATTKNAPMETTVSMSAKTCPAHLQKLCDVYGMIQREYIKKLSDEEMTDMFIRGFMKELNEKQNDPYSKYTAGKDKKTELEDGDKYVGIGMDMTKDTEPPYTIKVQRVFRGTPAHEAGMKRGDRITHINGVAVGNKTILESRNLIRGENETRITLTLSRPCERKPFRVSIRRREIEDTVSGMAKMIAPHYAYVYLPSFDAEQNIAFRVKYSLKRVSKIYGKPRGLIIDLRNNPGGSVLHAQYLVSLFVEKGAVLYDRAQNEREHSWNIADDNRSILAGVPIAILVNKDSASAAEIVAGAMQDFGRALIIGTKTFGKGVMQTHHWLYDGSDLYLTTGYTLTPNHLFIDKTGIMPDIFAEEGKNESCTGDRQLAVALDALRKKYAKRIIAAQ